MDLSVIGVTSAKKKQFASKGIKSVEGLIRYLPKDYYDFRNPKNIKDLEIDKYDCFIGKIIEKKVYPKMLRIIIADKLGTRLTLIFFHANYVQTLLNIGHEYIFCGKVTIPEGYHIKQCTNPIFSEDISKYKRILPIYPKINGMSEDYLLSKLNQALASSGTKEYLTLDIIREFDLIRNFEMERTLHQPKCIEDVEKAKKRLAFDELFEFSLITSNEYNLEDKSCPYTFSNSEYMDKFINALPYKLTSGENSQESVISEILKKMAKGERTNSLIQGDVSCGKTNVAIALMLAMVGSGYQAALMAPTTVLALQHYKEISEILEPLGIKCAFLGGKMPAKVKRATLEAIKTGEAKIIIGTHAVISKSVEFKNLSIAIVDEEHRFGVLQRRMLEKKSSVGVHTITMSATPIPRSLALTIYGSFIDVYTIKQMPSGRKPVITKLEKDSSKAYDFMYSEIKKGHQCYVICPLIEDSESEKMADIQSTASETTDIINYFKKDKSIRICEINGKMKQEEIDTIINSFKNHEFDIIVSTTIIEVGVNIPNSTVILIKNAERFGLATLHQLRGRVGRGSDQAYCILQSENIQSERLNIMESTTDGFKIATEDLKLRGMGDFIGTKQTGDNNTIMLMLSEPTLYDKIKKITDEIVKDTTTLSHYQPIIDAYNIRMGEEEEDLDF